MGLMAKDRPGGKKKRYPSRENTRYLGVRLDIYEALQRYASDQSDDVETRSASWAARLALVQFLTEKGYWPPAKKPPKS